jgi:hypothetical protein
LPDNSYDPDLSGALARIRHGRWEYESVEPSLLDFSINGD